MMNNLLQKIIEGNYSKHELDEIIEHAKYSKIVYEETEKKLANAQKDDIKKEKLQVIDSNIENLNAKIKKENKKQAKYILALGAVGFSMLIAFGLVSAFNLSFVPIFGSLSVAFVALGAVPIGIMDYKRKKLLNEITLQEQSRANILSDICFSVTPDYANNVYKEYKQNNTKYTNIENDNNLTL